MAIVIFIAALPIYAEEPARRPTCALIPFSNVTKRPAAAYLADRIQQSLHFGLGRTGRWQLIERARVKSLLMESDLKAAGIAAGRPAQLKGADVLILGAYEDNDGRVTVSARLVEASTGSILRQAQWTGHVSGIPDDMSARVSAALAGQPPPRPALSPDQQERFDKACRYLSRGQVERAIQACSKILDEHPRHVPTLLLRGDAQLRKKGWSHLAAKDFEKVLDIDEDNLAGAIGLARAKLLEDRRAALEAIKWLQQVLDRQPDQGEALWLTALAHERLHQRDQAMAFALRATQELPAFGPAWETLARLEMDRGDVAAALNAALTAIGADPDEPVYWVLLGDAQLLANQKQEAEASFRKAMHCAPAPDLKRKIEARMLRFK